MDNLSTVEYMVFPRLIALAEVAGRLAPADPGQPRLSGLPGRIAAQGGRLMAAGVNYTHRAEVRWRIDVYRSRT